MLGRGRVATGWAIGLISILLAVAPGVRASEPTVEQLKAKVPSASAGEKPRLCIQIAERELAVADSLYGANDIDQAQAKLTDAAAYAEQARDYAVRAHKYEKQAEIAVRNMARRLEDIKHVVAHEDQPPIQDALNRLQKVRDDLLTAMFPKGAK